jgi:hypothetical protein
MPKKPKAALTPTQKDRFKVTNITSPEGAKLDTAQFTQKDLDIAQGKIKGQTSDINVQASIDKYNEQRIVSKMLAEKATQNRVDKAYNQAIAAEETPQAQETKTQDNVNIQTAPTPEQIQAMDVNTITNKPEDMFVPSERGLKGVKNLLTLKTSEAPLAGKIPILRDIGATPTFKEGFLATLELLGSYKIATTNKRGFNAKIAKEAIDTDLKIINSKIDLVESGEIDGYSVLTDFQKLGTNLNKLERTTKGLYTLNPQFFLGGGAQTMQDIEESKSQIVVMQIKLADAMRSLQTSKASQNYGLDG